ncbi:MAG: ice-binding family protein [Prolixibacteraceae bacterium]
MKTQRKTVWMTTMVILLLATFMGACKKDENTGLNPTVTSTDPVYNESDVVLNKVVSINFSEAMDQLSINAASVTLKQEEKSIEGIVTSTGTSATFTPSSELLPNTVYTASVSSDAENLFGTTLANDYVWTFTTGTISSPMVISTDPKNQETGVTVNKVMNVIFSEAMDPSTIKMSSFTLMTGTSLVPGSVTSSNTMASFTPDTDLVPGTYTASISTEAKNASGIPMENDFVWSFSTNATIGAPSINLKTVERFGIIAGVGISNNAGFSEIHDMDIGIYPGVRSSVTGFPPAILVNGAIYASDDADPIPAMLIQAKQDLSDAFLFAESASTSAPITLSGDQGGKTLAPGIYKSTSTLLIQSGDLTLDAQGNENAIWVFQIASDFTTVGGAGGNVILSGGAQAKNIFWQTGRSATIGDDTAFKGNIMALTSITMNSGATATGRMLATNGSVVLTSNNKITKP